MEKEINILNLANLFEISNDSQMNSYIASYPYLLNYFSNFDEISAENVVCGTHMVYGWMPTILDLRRKKISYEKAGEILTNAKKEKKISLDDLNNLSGLINNSLVGASKLLHFIQPNFFPIWDSKICSFVTGRKTPSDKKSHDAYLDFIDWIKREKESKSFREAHKQIEKTLNEHQEKEKMQKYKEMLEDTIKKLEQI